MRYLYQRGRGSKRRVMHLCRFDQFGNATMQPICGRVGGLNFDTTCNVPLGQPLCKRCRASAA
jgi:hypothetical protein